MLSSERNPPESSAGTISVKRFYLQSMGQELLTFPDHPCVYQKIMDGSQVIPFITVNHRHSVTMATKTLQEKIVIQTNAHCSLLILITEHIPSLPSIKMRSTSPDKINQQVCTISQQITWEYCCPGFLKYQTSKPLKKKRSISAQIMIHITHQHLIQCGTTIIFAFFTFIICYSRMLEESQRKRDDCTKVSRTILFCLSFRF